jgi:hypothetical protein
VKSGKNDGASMEISDTSSARQTYVTQSKVTTRWGNHRRHRFAPHFNENACYCTTYDPTSLTVGIVMQ